MVILLLAGVGILPTKASENSLGFAERVKRTPTRMKSLPQNNKTRELLERYKPTFFVAPTSYHPIDFYENYLPSSRIETPSGEIIIDDPNRKDLFDTGYPKGTHLNYMKSSDELLQWAEPSLTPVYGRIYADTITSNGDTLPLLFLKYNLSFPYSGLPAGNNTGRELAANLAGDPWGWHELDIHGAVSVILHGSTREPLGVLLAQHNHHKSHLRSLDFVWPKSDRVTISYSIRSNEPYLITENDTSRFESTVGNPADILSLYEKTWIRPLSAGYDRILSPADGAVKVPTELELLPLDDPLYTTTLDLGDRYKLLGYLPTWFREGPPGINYYAPPSLKDLGDLTSFWYIDSTDKEFFRLLQDTNKIFHKENLKPILDLQRRKFIQESLKIRNELEKP